MDQDKRSPIQKIDDGLTAHQRIADMFPPAVTSEFNQLRTALETARPIVAAADAVNDSVATTSTPAV